MSAIAEAKTKRAKIYRSLEKEIAWFREEWQAGIPTKLHNLSLVDDGDHLGGPAWTERFRDYVASGVLWVDDEPLRLEDPREKLRDELRRMATGSVLEQRAARFLFALACLGFDPARAGLAMNVPLLPEYSYYYAEGAIGRLRQRMAQREERDRLPWQISRQYRELPTSQREAEAVA